MDGVSAKWIWNFTRFSYYMHHGVEKAAWNMDICWFHFYIDGHSKIKILAYIFTFRLTVFPFIFQHVIETNVFFIICIRTCQSHKLVFFLIRKWTKICYIQSITCELLILHFWVNIFLFRKCTMYIYIQRVL